MGVLLEALVARANTGAKAYAESLLEMGPDLSPGELHQRAMVAAGVLLWFADDAGWSVLWPSMTRNPAFGREVVENWGVLGQRGEN